MRRHHAATNDDDDDVTSRAARFRERSDIKCEYGRVERFERKRVRF